MPAPETQGKLLCQHYLNSKLTALILECDIHRPCTLCKRAGVDCSAVEPDVWKPVRTNQIVSKVRKADGDGSSPQATKRVTYSAQAIEDEAIATTTSSPAFYEASNKPREAEDTDPTTLQSPWASSSAAMSFVKEAFDHQDTVAPEGRDVSALSATHWTREGASGSTWPKQSQIRLKKLIATEAKLMMLLPDIRTATLLINNYFDKIHWFVLVFHQREFRDQFQQLYASDWQKIDEQKSRLGFVSVFLAVCAVSIQYTTSDQKQKLADRGIEQLVLQDDILDALRLRLLDIVSLGSLESIHTCVLLGTFYLYHGQPELAWPICGCGLRIAQALNLHRQSSSGSSTPDLDNPMQRLQETRKRCWWAIYEIETFCSMLYGFPLSISDRDCDVEPLHPYAVRSLDSTGDSVFRRAAGQPTLLSYKYFMVQLSIIVKAVLADLYGLHQSSGEPQRRDDKYDLKQLVEAITRLDARLQKWSQSLPVRLSSNDVIKDPTSGLPISSDRRFEDRLFQLQALALKLAFENARILVYRPLLSYKRVATTHTTSQSPVTQDRQAIDPFQTSTQICRDAAFQISFLGSLPIFQQVADTYAVSFVSQHLFTAGVTLSILTSLEPLSRESHESKMGLRRLMEMQTQLKSKSIIAEQGFGILKTLMSLILEKEAKQLLDFESKSMDDQISLNPQHLAPPRPHQANTQASDQPTASSMETSNDIFTSTTLSTNSPSFVDDENMLRFDIGEDPSMIQALFNFEQGSEGNTYTNTSMELNDMESSLENSFGGQDLGWIWSIDSYTHEKLAHLSPREANDTHRGGPSTDTPRLAPSRTSQEDDEFSELIAPSADAMGTSEGPTFTDSMTNFETFMGGLGFPSDFINAPFSLNMSSDLTTGLEVQSLEPGICGNDSQSTAGPLPFSRDLYPHDIMQSRKDSVPGSNYASISAYKTASLEMTVDDLKILEEGLRPFQSVLKDFTLPSLLIHFPTFQIGHCIPELILAMAALGAVGTMEENLSKKLYQAARSVALKRLKVNNLHLESATLPRSDTISRILNMQSTQTLVFLLVYSSWARDASVVAEGFELHSPLVQCMRASGFVDHDSPTEQSWIEWSSDEAERRTKYLAFCFLNIHTLIYNRPPSLLAREIQLRLPCPTKMWEITDELEWATSRHANICHPIGFQDAFESLVTPEAAKRENPPCAFSNLILLHGVVQRIYLLRQLSFGPNLGDREIDQIHSALFKWVKIWQRASGQDLHPSSEHGPIPFTSIAFLTVAYVRTHLDTGPNMWLATRNPIIVAKTLFSIAPPRRHSNLTSALLYTVHALSLPVAFGIDHVAKIFLSKWLEDIATCRMTNALEPYERHIISSVESVIKEALASGDWGDTDTSSWCQGPRQMSIAVLKIWSKVFSGESSWAITVHVGECLIEYAKIYENFIQYMA
ncbi:hypothetical protein MKX08_002892 [Trichoderma sp. CBMAI-0020]|nr:hypothetical protein MKX08_002892 [Trichoderma sp. CBMAI-0020]